MSYIVDKPIVELKPVEALALINRWLKLENYFYYDDRDKLYDLKYRKIVEWLELKEMVATAIIKRDNPTFAAMEEQIVYDGEDLNILDNYFDIEKLDLTDEDLHNYQVLDDFCCYNYEIAYSDDIIASEEAKYSQELAEYKVAKAAYDLEMKAQQPLISEYKHQLSSWLLQKFALAEQWAKENNIKIPGCKSDSRKKKFISSLERQGFKFDEPQPQRQYKHLQGPSKPIKPALTYVVTPDDYVPGSIPEIEKALIWAEQFVYNMPEYDELSDNFIVDLQYKIKDYILGKHQKLALDIFQQVVDGELYNSKEIYSALTKLNIDYFSSIGMKSYKNRNRNYRHADYSRWHQINFSATGYWLVEFQSLLEPSITFHIPYDACKQLDFKLNHEVLPTVESSEETYGRQVSKIEQENYPITKLVKLLGYEVSDFPYKLQKYSKPYSYHAHSFWDDEDEDEYEDEYDFMEVGRYSY